jgi:polar amino acid transport system ATP-binding protein
MVLNVNRLFITVDQNEIIKNLSFQVKKQEIVSILGPSGAGKTTLVRSLNGLTPITSGIIELNGKPRGDDNMEIGLVFQNFNLFPHLSVLENITLSPILRKTMNKDEIFNRAMNWLSILKLTGKEGLYPYQLSGGEKQRVAIARACILNPKLLCFDEPTSALDPQLSLEIAKLMKTLKEVGMTILIITHDMEFAKYASDRILTLDQGTITSDVLVNDYFT